MTFCLWLLGCSASTVATSSQETPTASPSIQVGQMQPQGQKLPITARARVGDAWIDLEVARTPQQQSMGLMFRAALPDNRGMLFSFDPPRPVHFWMKNVPVPLDMVFLRDGEVKAIEANVPPCTDEPCPIYGPQREIEIDRVIELRGGRSSELGLQIGDRIDIELFEDSTP
ncbi:MAG: DUF192 domain-containing protein [Geitlerinemataceae cyanobacterium]